MLYYLFHLFSYNTEVTALDFFKYVLDFSMTKPFIDVLNNPPSTIGLDNLTSIKFLSLNTYRTTKELAVNLLKLLRFVLIIGLLLALSFCI